jgi:hypothetical protein
MPTAVNLFGSPPPDHKFKVGETVRAIGQLVGRIKELHECGAVKVKVGGMDFWCDRMFLETEVPGAFDQFRKVGA